MAIGQVGRMLTARLVGIEGAHFAVKSAADRRPNFAASLAGNLTALILTLVALCAASSAFAQHDVRALAERADKAEWQAAIRSGLDVNAAKDNQGRTLLLAAVSIFSIDAGQRDQRLAEAVPVLIEAGADIEVKDSGGRTPLYNASGNGLARTVQVLIDAGAALETKISSGQTALYAAVSSGQSAVVRTLLEAGASVASGNAGIGLIQVAAREGHADIVETLIGTGIDADQQNEYGRTALMEATRRAQIDTIRLLLKHGANPDASPQSQMSARDTAAIMRFHEITALFDEARLRRQGKDAEADALAARPVEHGSALLTERLYDAISNGDEGLVARTLARKELDVNRINAAAMSVGDSPLNSAIRRGMYEIARMIVDAGADLDARDLGRDTPLSTAMQSYGFFNSGKQDHADDRERRTHQLANIRYLLEKGASPDIGVGGLGEPAILYATSDGTWDPDVAIIMAGATANPDVANFLGQTPLMQAAASPSHAVPVVAALLEAGADPYRRTLIGETAIGIAKSNSALRGFDWASHDQHAVRQLQAHLVSLGCDPGPIDGAIGAKTRAAAMSCRAFERVELPERLDVSTTRVFLKLYRQHHPV